MAEPRGANFHDAAGTTPPTPAPTEAEPPTPATPAPEIREVTGTSISDVTPATRTVLPATQRRPTGQRAFRKSTNRGGAINTGSGPGMGTATRASVDAADALRRATQTNPRAHMASPEEIDKLVVQHGLQETWNAPAYARDREAILGDPTTIFHEGKGMVRMPSMDLHENDQAYHSLNGSGHGVIRHTSVDSDVFPIREGTQPFNDSTSDKDYQRITFADRLAQIKRPGSNHPWQHLVDAIYRPAAERAAADLAVTINESNRRFNAPKGVMSRTFGDTQRAQGDLPLENESKQNFHIRLQKRGYRQEVAQKLQEHFPDVHLHVLTHALGQIPGDSVNAGTATSIDPLPLVGQASSRTGVEGKGEKPVSDFDPKFGHILMDALDHVRDKGLSGDEAVKHLSNQRHGSGPSLGERIKRIQDITHADDHFAMEISPETKAALQASRAQRVADKQTSDMRNEGEDSSLPPEERAAIGKKTAETIAKDKAKGIVPATVVRAAVTTEVNDPTSPGGTREKTTRDQVDPTLSGTTGKKTLTPGAASKIKRKFKKKT